MKRLLTVTAIAFSAGCFCQPQLHAQVGAAQTRLRPLGSPSAVDQYRTNVHPVTVQPMTDSRYAAMPVSSSSTGTSSSPVRNETAYWQADRQSQSNAAVRQTVWMQSSNFEPPPLPGGMGLPDAGTVPGQSAGPAGQPSGNMGFPNSTPFPEAAAPPAASTPLAPPPAQSFPSQPLQSRTLPSPPVTQSPPIGSPSDYSPIPQPSLQEQNFARVDNCHLVTGPSHYTAAMAVGCGGNSVMPTAYAAPSNPSVCGPITTGPITAAPGSYPAEIAAPATMPSVTVYPPVTRPNSFPNSSAPARSLITFGQENYPVQVGQGLWGQPVAYVPGQGVRNWMRYLSP